MIAEPNQVPRYGATTLGLTHGFHPPADGWIHLAPRGQFDHPSGIVQILDDQALTDLAERFAQEAAADNFPGLLVDFDHFSHDGSKPSEAAGWITALDVRSDGLWGHVRWSDAGEAAVRGGRYRLVSPVWNGADGTFWPEADATHFRPGRLDRVALTNDPNLSGLVPLTNRQTPEPTPTKNSMNYRDELLRLLKLPAEATDLKIESSLAALEEQLAHLETLETEAAQLRESAVEADLEEFADVIAEPAAVREQLIANRAGTRRLLAALRRAPYATARRPLHNRAATRIPAGVSLSGEQEAKRARRIANRARELQRDLKIGHTAAFNLARGEILHG